MVRRLRQLTVIGCCILVQVFLQSSHAFTSPLQKYKTRSFHPSAASTIIRFPLALSPSDQSKSVDSNLPSLLEPGGGPTIVIQDSTTAVYQSAVQRTLLWVTLAGIFGGGLWTFVSPNTGEEFFAGYLVEQSLSVDNLFVFLLLFEFFKVPLAAQDKVLNFGIFGAIVMRAIMISLGAAALENFHAILLLFAAILVYSSAKVLTGDDEEADEDMADNAIVKFSKKLIDSTDDFDGDNFFTMVGNIRKATPLFICMIAIEISDVVFAVDSVPAVFGVTEVCFLVTTMDRFYSLLIRHISSLYLQQTPNRIH